MVPGVILVFFGVGAWITALCAFAGLAQGTAVQLLIFSLSSLALLIVLRRRIRGRFFGHIGDDQDPAVDLDEFVGRRVTVVHAITPGAEGGRVEFKGASWAADSVEPIAEGAQAVIIARDGITLRVRPADGGTAEEESND
jgi:membrane protein implicated in regulation of membrane protease activity